jgi:hypothetical protein
LEVTNYQQPIKKVKKVVEVVKAPEYNTTYYSLTVKSVNISGFVIWEYDTDMEDEKAGFNMSQFNQENFEVKILVTEDTEDLIRVNKKKLEPTVTFNWETKFFKGREVGILCYFPDPLILSQGEIRD